MITDNIIVQFLVIVLGMATIGRLFLGGFGALVGLVIGLYMFWMLRKHSKKNVDYDRIEELFKKYR
jgi:hypothetical protein